MRRLALALLFTACDGTIWSPPKPPPVEPPPPPPAPKCEDTLAVGRSMIHRLTRLEYDRTVAALLGDTSEPARAFPEDVGEAGFDNVSDLQTVSLPIAREYEGAAWKLAEGLWEREYDTGLDKRWNLDRLGDGGVETLQQTCCTEPPYHHVEGDGGYGFFVAYDALVHTALDRAGDYTIRFDGWAQFHADAGPLLEDGGAITFNWNVKFDDVQVLRTPVQGTAAMPRQHQVTVHAEQPGVYRARGRTRPPRSRTSSPSSAPRRRCRLSSTACASATSPPPAPACARRSSASCAARTAARSRPTRSPRR
jgi:hypothetical protein